jgi:hypothetical protein
VPIHPRSKLRSILRLLVKGGLVRVIHHLLQDRFTALITHRPADNTTDGAIYQRDDVDYVFLLPT